MFYNEIMKVEDFLKDNSYQIKDCLFPIVRIREKEDLVVLYLKEEKISISIEDYFYYGLSSCKGLDEHLYQELKRKEKSLLAYRGCLRKLSMKDFSTEQIIRYLNRYDLDKDETESIIQKLEEYDLLNDERYCIGRIDQLNKTMNSSRQIRQKLSKEGIDNELIQTHLKTDAASEREKAFSLAEKCLRTMRGRSSRAMKQAILQKLTGQGFSYDIASEVCSRLVISSDNEDELLDKEYQKALKKYAKKYEGRELDMKIYAYLLGKGFEGADIKKRIANN